MDRIPRSKGSLPRFRLSSYKLTTDVMRNVEVSTRFKPKEIRKLHQQFQAIADRNGQLGPEGFRQSMGILGMVQDSILCQRLFSVFNQSQTGLITFEEFAKGLGVLVKGTVDEKLTFAFAMTDIDGSGEITPEELEITVDSIMRIYAGIMGSVNTASLDRNKIRKMFNQLDKNRDGYITLEEYKRGMKQHPEFVASLRGHDLFSIGNESALKEERSRTRRYKRVAKSIMKDVDESIALLEAVLHGPSSEEGTVTPKEQSPGDVKAAGVPNPDGEDEGYLSDITILSEDFESSYESDADLAFLSPNRTMDSEPAEISKMSILKRELLEEGFHGLGPALEGVEKIEKASDTQEEEPPARQASRSSQVSSASTPILPKNTKRKLRLSLSSCSSILSNNVNNRGAGAADDLVPMEQRLMSLLHTIKAKAQTIVDDGTTLRRQVSNLQSSTLNEPPSEPILSPTSVRSEPVRSRINYELSVDQDYIVDTLLNSPTARVKPAEGKGSGGGDGKDDDGALGKYLTSASKGSTVFFGHRNWDLVINVMKGIQMAVGRSAAEATRSLNVFDFNIKEKYTLVAGSKLHKHHHRGGVGLKDIDSDRSGRSCRFVDYAPVVFAKLREHFGIRNEEYVHSIGPGNMLSNLMLGSLSSLAELGSEGKSGSFFYFTSDGMFMVKTIHKDEHKLLRNILPQYYYHMTAGPDSLLCRIVGCHVLRLSKNSKIGANKIYFVVMQNVLNTDLDLDLRFDLKGSWVGRKSSEEARKNPKSTLKDLDLQDMKRRIRVGPERKEMLLAAIRRDAKFLEDKHIIDYSLLVGISTSKMTSGIRAVDSAGSLFGSSQIRQSLSSDRGGDSATEDEAEPERPIPFFQKDCGGMLSSDGKETYVMGIIDFLTLYSSKKVAERFGKSWLFDSDGISVQPPQKYAKRFVDFMDSIIE